MILLKLYKYLIYLLAFLSLLAGLFSCTEVRSYQKAYVNDAEMELSPRKIEFSEMNFLQYREGGSGGNGGKSGGGCGCN